MYIVICPTDALEVTKCVTIHTFKPQRLLPTADKWVNCFNVSSPTIQALNTKCELESANTSHLLLSIDVPDQQPYHLPMLITPILCVYLVTFDLRKQEESLDRIHCVMKNVYTLTSYCRNVNQLPKVFLVGMHADEVVPEDRKHFAQDLNERLKKMPYDRLVDRPDGDGPFWAVDGGDLCLSSSECLLRQIQEYSSVLSVEVRQWISHHIELQKKLEDTPCPCYNELAEVACLSSDPEDRTFQNFIQFLHNYGFIFCHSVEEGAKDDPVVLLRPQYLCTLFAEVQKLSKKRKGLTIADLLSSAAKSGIRDSAKLKQWFQRICIDMGLVVQVRCDYVFLMALEPGPPSSPHHNEYSVPPLLMSFIDSNHFTMAHEYLLPSHFFAAFATEVLQALNPNQLPDIKQHYMVIRMANALIHIVDRGFCIEIGLQKVDVGSKRLTDKEKVKKLGKLCKQINSAIVKSSEDAVRHLKLAKSSIRYGFYSTPEIGSCADSFGAYVSNEEEGSFLNCSCCCHGLHPTTPLQRIWYEESAVEEVCKLHNAFHSANVSCMYSR